MNQVGASRVRPFFLDAIQGRRFCIHYPPAVPCRGSVLYVHPFAEEMNKSRRMAAMQARELAKHGFSVLAIDCYGCGDSSGDFLDARWEIWKEDLALGVEWLKREYSGPVSLLGLRLGALLMLDFAKTASLDFERIVLWQPVVSGQIYLTQFLRLRLASDMLTEGGAKSSVQDLRNALANGEILEIAGYGLAPELAQAIDKLKLADLGWQGKPPCWFEISQNDKPLSPAATQVLTAWADIGMHVEVRIVRGEPFWQTQEISECPDLLAETTRCFSDGL